MADLIYGNQIWEVKSGGYDPVAATGLASTQLARYLAANSKNLGLRISAIPNLRLGDPIAPFSVPYGKDSLQVTNPSRGVLLYTFAPALRRVPATAPSRAPLPLQSPTRIVVENLGKVPVPGNPAFDPLGLRGLDWISPPSMDPSGVPTGPSPLGGGCLFCIPIPVLRFE